MDAHEFQQWLLGKLHIPLLHFPKGNPTSGQTWPELSFRMLLRHIYRQQRFWGDIADKQPEMEQHACLLQFLGLAENLFTEEYGRLVQRKSDAEQLRARRDQFGATLDELARDLVAQPGLSSGVSAETLRAAEARLSQQVQELRQRRSELLLTARDGLGAPEQRNQIADLGQQRADALSALEEYQRKTRATADRLSHLRQYRADLADELERLARAGDAGAVLADLKITHCPACDQEVTPHAVQENHCFLCHQQFADELMLEGLGDVRLKFEQDRISGELKEAQELSEVLQRELGKLKREGLETEEALQRIESKLAPSRTAVSALVRDDVSALDMGLGEASERQRQLSRISSAFEVGTDLAGQVTAIEREVQLLRDRVDEAVSAIDFEAAADALEAGMNAYLRTLNELRPNTWRHNPVKVDVYRSRFGFRVGTRRWSAALGGTDTLYFLMAYHFGLMTLSDRSTSHYPGLSIIDLPGDFLGEAIEDKENFIVQPFIDLLNRDEYEGAQLIITGASFAGLAGAHMQKLTHVYVA
jgi:hypothetical protein